jgi:hypothetical protein
MADPISGHTTTLTDGGFILSPSLTNLIAATHGNGILSLEDTATTASTRNTPASLPGAVTHDGNYTITIKGGHAVIDGLICDFADGYTNNAPTTMTLQLTAANTSGSNSALGSGEQCLFVVYVTSDTGSGNTNKGIRVEKGTNTTTFPSTPSAFLTDPDSSLDVKQSTVLAVVRATYQASNGGDLNVDIQEVFDVRTFLKPSPIYFTPMVKSAVGAAINDTTRINEFQDLDAMHGAGNENGQLEDSTLGAMWMSKDVHGNDALYFSGKLGGSRRTFKLGPDNLYQASTSSNITFEYDDYNYFLITPGAGITLNPDVSDAAFPPGHTVIVTNLAANTHSIAFDSTGINTSIGPQSWGIFSYTGSAWVKVLDASLSTSTSAGNANEVQLGTASAAFAASSSLTFNASSNPKLLTLGGNASISGLVYNPTGLQFTKVNDNPGNAFTLWVDEDDSDKLKFGTSEVSVGAGTTTFLGLSDTPSSFTNGHFLKTSGSEVTSAALANSDLPTALTSVVSIGRTNDVLTVSKDLTVTGNFIVNGETTTINSNTLTVDDKFIQLGNITSGTITGTFDGTTTVTNVSDTSPLVAGMTITGAGGYTGIPGGTTIVSVDNASQITISQSASAGAGKLATYGASSDLTSDGGGIKLAGTSTNKEITWSNTNDAWTFNQNIYPSTDSTYNLGSSAIRFATGYLDAVDVTSVVAGTITGSGDLNVKKNNGDSGLLYVDKSADKVGINTGTDPAIDLEVGGAGFSSVITGGTGGLNADSNVIDITLLDSTKTAKFKALRLFMAITGTVSGTAVTELSTAHVITNGSSAGVIGTPYGVTLSAGTAVIGTYAIGFNSGSLLLKLTANSGAHNNPITAKITIQGMDLS